MAIGNKITGALTSFFGGNEEEEEDAPPAAPLSVMAASPRTAPEGVVDYGQMKQLLQQQIERLRNERPNRADEFLAFASGLGRPTKTGSFGESLGYANEALAKQSAESAKARAARQEMMLKYGIDLATLGVEEQKNTLTAKAKTAAELAKLGEIVKGTYTVTKNDLNQTIASYLTGDGYFVTQNLAVPSEFKVVKAPVPPNNAASPSPPTPPGGGPPSVEALAPKPAAGAAPLFLGSDGKRHAVGDGPYEGLDGFLYRMGENGQETVVSKAQSEAYKARERSAQEDSKAREARTAADIAADASTEKPTAPERADYYAQKTALRGFDQGLASMDRALAANGLAFEGTFASLASGAARLTGRNKEELAATAVVRTALGEASLSSLKAMFPGSITEGEREALDALYARGRTATRDERIAIIGEIKQWIRDKQAASLGLVQSYQQQYPSYFKIDPTAKTPVEEARAAIAKGANRDAVIKRLKENGIAPPGDL